MANRTLDLPRLSSLLPLIENQLLLWPNEAVRESMKRHDVRQAGPQHPPEPLQHVGGGISVERKKQEGLWRHPTVFLEETCSSYKCCGLAAARARLNVNVALRCGNSRRLFVIERLRSKWFADFTLKPLTNKLDL